MDYFLLSKNTHTRNRAECNCISFCKTAIDCTFISFLCL